MRRIAFQITLDNISLVFYSHYHYYYSLIRTFHISVSRWFFTGVWVTASLLKSPGLVSVFWPFSLMLSFRWSPPVHQLPSPPLLLLLLLLLSLLLLLLLFIRVFHIWVSWWSFTGDWVKSSLLKCRGHFSVLWLFIIIIIIIKQCESKCNWSQFIKN